MLTTEQIHATLFTFTYAIICLTSLSITTAVLYNRLERKVLHNN